MRKSGYHFCEYHEALKHKVLADKRAHSVVTEAWVSVGFLVPIENELKYVLTPAFEAASLKGWARSDIRQAYLAEGPRIRHVGDVFLFTYKKWIEATREIVEIETRITHEDFTLLWPLCDEVVTKTRYTKITDDGEWVIDFLYDPLGQIYFVMAEVEMARNVEKPKSIVPEIVNHIRYVVNKGDSRFSNRRLSNPAYAQDLMERIALDIESFTGAS